MSHSPRLEFVRRHARAILASLALVAGFAWVLDAGSLPLLPPDGTLEAVEPSLVALAASLILMNMLLRFARFYFLIAPIARVSFWRVLRVLFVCLGLITLLPFRIGEVARPVLLREKGKLSAWAVTGTVGAERIIDGLMVAAMLLFGLALAEPQVPLPERIGQLPVPVALVPRAAWLAIVVFGGAFVAMAVFFWARVFARRMTEVALGLVSKRLAMHVADAIARMSDGLRFLPNLRYTAPYVACTLAALWVNVVGLQLLASAAGLPPLSFAQASVVLGVLSLGFAVPNAPGFFGAIQLALYAGLAVYVEPDKIAREGAAFVFLYYVVHLGLVALVTTTGLIAEYVCTPDAAEDSSSAEAR